MDRHLFSSAAGELAIWESPGTEPPLICLHGFTLRGAMFAALETRIGHRLLAPDLPGHGATRIEPVDLPSTLTALAGWLGHLGGPHVLLGYSQGGRIALQLAAHHPELIHHVIAVSSTLGIVDPAARTERRRADEALAAHIEEIGADAFLDEWSRHPLIGTSHLDPSVVSTDRQIRSDNTAAGLAAALRGLGQGAVPPIAPEALRCPVTWVSGKRDDRYRTAAADAAIRVGGRSIVVAGAGHNVVLEAPDALAHIAAEVLSGVP